MTAVEKVFRFVCYCNGAKYAPVPADTNRIRAEAKNETTQTESSFVRNPACIPTALSNVANPDPRTVPTISVLNMEISDV